MPLMYLFLPWNNDVKTQMLFCLQNWSDPNFIERDIAERKYFRRIYQNRLAKLDTVVYDLPLTQLLMYLFLQWNNDVKMKLTVFRRLVKNPKYCDKYGKVLEKTNYCN